MNLSVLVIIVTVLVLIAIFIGYQWKGKSVDTKIRMLEREVEANKWMEDLKENYPEVYKKLQENKKDPILH